MQSGDTTTVFCLVQFNTALIVALQQTLTQIQAHSSTLGFATDMRLEQSCCDIWCQA
jgi:hypothetical protein